MAWEKIARRHYGGGPAVPRDGCAVSTRKFLRGGRALVFALGPALVAKMGWADEVALAIAAGTGPDAGRLRLSRAEGRGWMLKPKKAGHWEVVLSVLPPWMSEAEAVRLAAAAEPLTGARGDAWLTVTLPPSLVRREAA